MLKPNNQDRRWQILDSEYLIRRPWLTARKDRVRLPNGVENNEYYVLEYPDWVNVVALTRDGRFLMERQYRHGLQLTSYEICAGVCEAGETPLQSAQRELYEETGYGGGTWTPWMDISANTSTMTNLTHCFLATDVDADDQPNQTIAHGRPAVEILRGEPAAVSPPSDDYPTNGEQTKDKGKSINNRAAQTRGTLHRICAALYTVPSLHRITRGGP